VTPIAIDTNVLVYAEGLNGVERRDAALALLQQLDPETTYLPAQVLAELFHVLVRKARLTRAAAERIVLSWGETFPIIETSSDVTLLAMTLSRDHDVSTWDAIILAAAADARCRVLLSEDLQDGFCWGGVTVVNPFAAPPHDRLRRLLA